MGMRAHTHMVPPVAEYETHVLLSLNASKQMNKILKTTLFFIYLKLPRKIFTKT